DLILDVHGFRKRTEVEADDRLFQPPPRPGEDLFGRVHTGGIVTGGLSIFGDAWDRPLGKTTACAGDLRQIALALFLQYPSLKDTTEATKEAKAMKTRN